MKNLKTFRILVFALMIFCSGCRKEREFICKSNCLIFTGNVIDGYTNDPIKHGEIKLYMDPQSTLGSDRIEIAQTSTDKNGNYEIRLEEHDLYKKRNNWVVTCKKDGYLWTHDYDSGTEIEDVDSTFLDSPNEANIRLIPSASLSVELDINLNLLSGFYYQVDYGTEPDNIFIWESGQFNRRIIHEVAGDRFTYVTFFPGTLTPGRDSIFINSGKSGTIKFNYN